MILSMAMVGTNVPPRNQVGLVIGGNELVCKIGRGGMAEVWLARKPVGFAGEKLVAVKLIADHCVGDERYTRMFRSEAELAAMLSHANIVNVFDRGEQQGRNYIVMEWVDGVNLSGIVSILSSVDDLSRFRIASYITGQLLHALHYAHSLVSAEGQPLGIVHRDVSPENVLVGRNGDVKLTDFGVASSELEKTSGVHFKGKIRYMPPEQLRGETRSPALDIFAVGALLHELLDGRPFRSDFPPDKHFHLVVFSGDVPPLLRTIPPELDQLRVSLLEADSSRRLQTAADALAMLQLYPGYGDARDELIRQFERHRKSLEFQERRTHDRYGATTVLEKLWKSLSPEEQRQKIFSSVGIYRKHMLRPGAVHVFVSFSHDSRTHEEDVLSFSRDLADEGFNVFCELTWERPQKDWAHSVRKALANADYVCCVCSFPYRGYFEGDRPTGRGRGVSYEGALIRQEIVRQSVRRSRFLPILFPGARPSFIPAELGEGVGLYFEWPTARRYLVEQLRTPTSRRLICDLLTKLFPDSDALKSTLDPVIPGMRHDPSTSLFKLATSVTHHILSEDQDKQREIIEELVRSSYWRGAMTREDEVTLIQIAADLDIIEAFSTP